MLGNVERRRRTCPVERASRHRSARLLRNHGILTAGPSVESAAWWYIELEDACHVQLLAEAAGEPQPIPHEQAALTHSQIGRQRSADHAFDSLWQGLVESAPDLLD